MPRRLRRARIRRACLPGHCDFETPTGRGHHEYIASCDLCVCMHVLPDCMLASGVNSGQHQSDTRKTISCIGSAANLGRSGGILHIRQIQLACKYVLMFLARRAPVTGGHASLYTIPLQPNRLIHTHSPVISPCHPREANRRARPIAIGEAFVCLASTCALSFLLDAVALLGPLQVGVGIQGDPRSRVTPCARISWT